jgi:hypothetical protein
VGFDEPLLDELARGELTLMHRHDRVVSDEDRDLVVGQDTRTRRLQRIEDDEVVRLVPIDLGILMAVLRTLDGAGMELKLLRDKSELLALRV